MERSSLGQFKVCVLSEPDQIGTTAIVGDHVGSDHQYRTGTHVIGHGGAAHLAVTSGTSFVASDPSRNPQMTQQQCLDLHKRSAGAQ